MSVASTAISYAAKSGDSATITGVPPPRGTFQNLVPNNVDEFAK